jgi:hypothetical protein
MDRSKIDAPAVPVGVEVPARLPWNSPRLVRMGTVAALTSKIDVIGRNDGGSGTKKRT